MNKKVLYLHGLNSKLHDDRRLVLNKFNLDIQAPHIDYENEPNRLKELIGSFDADFVIGSSAGGLAGYYISGFVQVPALLFNPALPFRNKMESIPNLPNRNEYLQIVLGGQDKVVPAIQTFEFLNQTLDSHAPLSIHWIHPMEHQIPIKVFENEVGHFLSQINS
ncbi:MAG: YqiA/YcfP family alpha/beta fold hydrolase [Weeksellaceae bacterium]